VLCANACVRAGAGLVTLYVTEDIYPIAGAAAIPEVMVRPIDGFRDLLETRRDVLALGPGLGQERKDEVLELIRRCEQPMIIDADGLNILAQAPEVLREAAGPRLLTPHPGEMARLAPETAGRSRQEIAEQWAAKYPGTLLLKGARTLVAEAGRPLSYNTTGNPGMGSGGMGDTLTGVCAALAGQGLPLYDCARLGAWLCGHAAELAVAHNGDSEESLTASGVAGFLGRAFRNFRAGVY
jgi:NAD(P)H-hydrate epimerase